MILTVEQKEIEQLDTRDQEHIDSIASRFLSKVSAVRKGCLSKEHFATFCKHMNSPNMDSRKFSWGYSIQFQFYIITLLHFTGASLY